MERGGTLGREDEDLSECVVVCPVHRRIKGPSASVLQECQNLLHGEAQREGKAAL